MNETITLRKARVCIHVERAYDFDERQGLWIRRQEDPDEVVENIVTDAGRVRLHTFCYNTASRANGLNYIGLTDDSSVPAAGDTSLTAEITGNGLDRAQGTVTLPTGSGNQTLIAHPFTYVGVPAQTLQKAALFDAAYPSGTMAHEIQYTQRTLFTNDLITISYTITLG